MKTIEGLNRFAFLQRVDCILQQVECDDMSAAAQEKCSPPKKTADVFKKARSHVQTAKTEPFLSCDTIRWYLVKVTGEKERGLERELCFFFIRLQVC